MIANGDKREAAALEELLQSQDTAQSLKPSRVIQSTESAFPGEILTSRVAPPVDKETGAALADIHFPEAGQLPPVLPENVSRAIHRLIEEWAHIEKLNAVGAIPPRTCMLFGKPGTGKTKLAHYISDQLGVPMVLARLDGLVSSFLGTTARNIGALFNFANRYRCLLLLDEFDALAKMRDDPQEVGEIKRVVNALLQNIDKRRDQGFTIAITNHETLLDPAVWRRFEIRINVMAPGLPERIKILDRYVAPLPIDSAELSFLAWISEGMTGSDLENMMKSLKRFTAIHSKGDFVLIDNLRAYAVTNAGADRNKRMEMLLESPHEIARRLVDDEEININQQDIGRLLGKGQATISRWLKNDMPVER
jgi:SpoVK/Ycf46/Vps4 family AAA+-type ATPase